MSENERLVRVEESSKQAHKRIDILDEKTEKRVDSLDKKIENIYDLTSSVKEIAIEMKAMREDVNKIDNRVSAIEEKPKKQYENIITTIISCIVTAMVTYFLVKMGVK